MFRVRAALALSSPTRTKHIMTGKKPPPGFTSLSDAQDLAIRTRVSIIGVVVDYMPPKDTARKEFVVTFKLQDPKLRDVVYGHEGLKVRWFAKRLEDLPQIHAIGDVVLAREVQASEFHGEKMLISGPRSMHLVFSGSALPLPAFKLEYVSGNAILPCHGTDGQRGSLTPVVQEYIIDLKSELNIEIKKVSDAGPASTAAHSALLPARRGPPMSPIPVAGGLHRFRLVKDLQHHVFSDLCVEVVKKFPNNYGKCELYVTDFTANEHMFYYAPPEEKQHDLVRDGDQFGYQGPAKRDWPGPWGFLIFRVSLVDPHAAFAIREVEEGDMVTMQNVKVKAMQNGRLEGDMWPDQNNLSKVQIRKINYKSPQLDNLRLRKDEYWTGRHAIAKKAEDAVLEAEGKLSKAERKKLKKRKREEEARKEAEQKAAEDEKKISANPHVRCSHIDHPLVTISHILDSDNVRHTNTLPSGESYTLPFVNAKHHIKARVVDFFPPRLEDFAVQLTEAEMNDDKSEYSADMTWDSSAAPWEWCFALQLEEVSKPASGANTSSPNKMWVHVSHLQAQHLFGNAVEDPTDLRKDTALLKKLREKLYILWGDLEERKRADWDEEEGRKAKRAKLAVEGADQAEDGKPSNRPFNCCVIEYGELREGGRKDDIADWERQYMLFGVLIN
ncbi:hypothetical protein Q7P37_002156 [Cladosporium fusiforme]